MEKKGKKERESTKEEKPSSGAPGCSKQALDLSSTSVILFEEVSDFNYFIIRKCSRKIRMFPMVVG